MVDPLHYEPADSPDFDEADDFDGVYESAEEGRAQSLKSVDNPAQDKILKYCLIASVVLHIAFFTGIPRLMEITPCSPSASSWSASLARCALPSFISWPG